MKINQIIIILFLFSFCLSQYNGLEYYQNQEYEEAKNYYENIIMKKKENVEAHFGSGASSYQKGDWEVAKQSFQESLKSSDDNLRSKTYYNLGNTFYKDNKSEEAISFYRKALELNPNDKEARFNYEYLKYQKKPPEEDNKEKEKQEQKEEEEEQKEKEQEQKEEEEEQKEKEQEQKEKEQNQDEQNKQNQEQEKSSNEEKDQDLKQAESILDALKQDEKIMQKKQISRAKSRKLAKDW